MVNNTKITIWLTDWLKTPQPSIWLRVQRSDVYAVVSISCCDRNGFQARVSSEFEIQWEVDRSNSWRHSPGFSSGCLTVSCRADRERPEPRRFDPANGSDPGDVLWEIERLLYCYLTVTVVGCPSKWSDNSSRRTPQKLGGPLMTSAPKSVVCTVLDVNPLVRSEITETEVSSFKVLLFFFWQKRIGFGIYMVFCFWPPNVQ